MSDYKGIFANEFSEDPEDMEDIEPVFASRLAEYEVRVMHTKEVAWTGTVMATSKKDAQSVWRREYPHIRSQYTHEYGLGIRRK